MAEKIEEEFIEELSPKKRLMDGIANDMYNEGEPPAAEVQDSDIFKIELITPRSGPSYTKINNATMLNKDVTTSILTQSDIEYVEELHDSARHYINNKCLRLVAIEYARKGMLRENIAVSRNGAGRIMLNTEIRKKEFNIKDEEKKQGWLR